MVRPKDSTINTHICLDLIRRVKIFLEHPPSLLHSELIEWDLKPLVVILMLLVLRPAVFSQVILLGKSLTQRSDVFDPTTWTTVSILTPCLPSYCSSPMRSAKSASLRGYLSIEAIQATCLNEHSCCISFLRSGSEGKRHL